MPTQPPPGTLGPAGNLPGTEYLGVIYLEYVDVERKSGGVWGQIAGNVPATFEPLKIHTRAELETWSHKPLFCLWMFPGTPLDDGDRVIRSDGSHWYIRGAPLKAPRNTHIAALAERATEDSLFATRNPNEPS
jgi:hypothetical protein